MKQGDKSEARATSNDAVNLTYLVTLTLLMMITNEGY